MENYDLFGDDLGGGMLDSLGDLGGNNFGGNSSNQPTGAGNMMQGYNNQQPQYTQIGQGIAPPSKLTPGGYPDYAQYGQYGPASSLQTAQQPGLGNYGGGGGQGPSRPMAGYPYPHQPTASPSMHYQDYSVQSQVTGMGMRPVTPSQPHAPPPRMVTPTPQQSQQFGGYRPPGQDSMYLQQFPRWNEQQAASPYGASSLPHHYPSNATSTYRAPAPPPHAYPSSLPRPPQSMTQQQQPPAVQPPLSNQPPPPSGGSVNSQQHNIPYMARPQTPSAIPSQPSQSQYGQNMYPSSNNQYPNYLHSAASLGQLPSGPAAVPSGPSYSHHTPQQQYSLTPTPNQQQHQYGNQYGQYYPGSGLQPLSSQASLSNPSNPMSYSSAYPSSVPSVNLPPVIANGSPASYRPGYAQLPQLSPRQSTAASPRQPVPSPRPTSSTTPTLSAPPSQPAMSQGQQQQHTVQTMSQSSQPPPSSQQLPPQTQQPSSLQQLEQMVMPHVSKNSPSPKPLSSMTGGVMSPMGGPKTPMSPGMSGPKTPMSPGQWQSSNVRPPAPPIASKPSYLHPPQLQVPSSPNNYGMNNSISSSISSIDNTINSVVRSSQEAADLELNGLSASLDSNNSENNYSSIKEEIKPSTPLPTAPLTMSTNDANSLHSLSDVGVKSDVNSAVDSIQQVSSSRPGEDQLYSLSNTSTRSESRIEDPADSALSLQSNSMENSQTTSSQYNSNSTVEPNSMNAINSSLNPSSPLAPVTPALTANGPQQQETNAQYSTPPVLNSLSSPMINGTSNEPQTPHIGLHNQGLSTQGAQGPLMTGYGNVQQQQSQPYNSIGSPQSGIKPMMPPPPSPHQYPTPRFPAEAVSQPPSQSPYNMGVYHNNTMYPGSHYGQTGSLPAPLRSSGPPQYPMVPQSIPGNNLPGGPNADRYNYEIHQLQQQLQHIYSLPPTPQTQSQVGELQERLRILQQQVQSIPGSGYPVPPMAGMTNSPGYLPHPGLTMDASIDPVEPAGPKSKKKKERKPRDSKGKGKKGKTIAEVSDETSHSSLPPAQSAHEVYEFEDVPPEIPEKKTKKPSSRKPRENKSPKEKKVKEPKPPKEKSPPKRSRKKKPNGIEPSDVSNVSLPASDVLDGELSVPKLEENLESDQKNGIGAAGITAAEGGSSTPISGGEGDTSTQETVAPSETASSLSSELVTPEKPKKPKKPKLKSSSTGKKRPSRTLAIQAFKNRKKRRRSDSEVSDVDKTPPPSPPPEDDSNKRRSGRNTKRKKYIDDIDLALSDEELLLPNKAQLKAMKALEASTLAAAVALSTEEITPVVEGQESQDTVKEPTPPVPVPKPVITPKVVEEPQNLNKHNFFYVNTNDEDTMVVQHILTLRMGTREVIEDSSDEEEDAPKKSGLENDIPVAATVNVDEVLQNIEGGEVDKPEPEDMDVKETEENVHDSKIEEKAEISEEVADKDITEELLADEKVIPVVNNANEIQKEATNTVETSIEIINNDKNSQDGVETVLNSESEKSVGDQEKMDVVESVEKPDESEAKDSKTSKGIKECSNVEDTSVNEDPLPKTTELQDVKSENNEDDMKSSTILETEHVEEITEDKNDEAESEGGKSPKKKREPKTIEVEEFYVKYKNFSYLHCEWKTEEELMKGDKRVNQKIKRFKQKLANNANIFEFIEEDPFNPDYVEVDRVLDMSEVTDPSGKTTKNYLVKWRSLPYDEATWELEEDIDPEKLAHFRRFYKLPPKDQWKVKKRPKASEWVKLDETLPYRNGNSLREYQLEGLNWLSFSWYNGRNCILADEMGLGKTIQSLTFVESVYRYGIRGPFLVIAPLSTVPNWQREFETWTDLNVVVYHGSVASRNMIQEYELFYRHPDNPQMNLKDVYKFNVIITTFEIVLTDVMELKDFPFRVCVIDEAHRLKNKNCKLLEGLRLLNLEHRVLLSGTPLQNNVQELFSLLNFLEPSQFSSDENFIKEFGELKTDTQVQKLQALLKPMMLRRLKEDVEKSIAPKEETIVEVELTNMQKKYYRAILERNFSFLSKGTSSANIPNLMNTMMELRKCCIHPYLLNGAEEQIQLDYRLNYNLPESDPDLYYKALVNSSGKMVLVDKLLPKLKANGHRVLVFSQMVRCLDILEDYLIYRKYPYERLDGRIRGSVRQAAIDRYSKPDSDRFVFLLCTKAGGLGINLTAADTVIIYDSDWNPQNDLQAQARCHRIGQSKKVKIYRLICRNTYEREMFDRASLKLGLDKAVLQSMNTTQGGKPDLTTPTKQLTKKEVEDLLKRGAYGALMDEDNAGEKFCEEDIDFILERRTQIITLESGEKGSTFSKASFAATGIREDINVDDPDFWKKWAKKAEIDVDEGGQKNDLVIDEPRRRTQIKRYGHDEGIMEISELESSSESDEEGNVGDRTRSGKAGRRTRSGKPGKRGRRGNMDDDFQCDDGVVEYGRWSKSECYKIERGLLTYGWRRWTKILEQGQFRKGWNEKHMEDCARLILLHCVTNFRGDDKIRSFVADLICPVERGITRNHSGLANPVSRGGRKSKKKDKAMKENEEVIVDDDWTKEEKFETDLHLDPNYTKHLCKNANKVLLRIRMLYYIKQEIIGIFAQKIDEDVSSADLPICPPGLIVDHGPVDWWNKEADGSLLIGTYKHGYERYNIMRQDPTLCFLSRCGPPDGSAVLAEISSEVNEEELDKEDKDEKDVVAEDEDEESNMEVKEPSVDKQEEEKPPSASNPTPNEENPDETVASSLPIWPSSTDLNTRIRKLITGFQRHFKKEEIKSAQKAKRMERKEKIEQIVRDRERQKMEIYQKRWSKKEESDFYRTVSTFGVQRIEAGKYDWNKFKAISRLEKKFDETLTEYFRAFYAMCKRICGIKLTEQEEFDLIQVPVDPLPEDRARRTMDRIDLLNKIREEIIVDDKLEDRLRTWCLPSLDMPEWWIAGKHDRDLVYGAARHGLGRTDLFYLNDPELCFREILRRHIAGEPLLDMAEKLAYRNGEKKFKVEPEPILSRRLKPDMVDIEIQDIKGEREEAQRQKEAEENKNPDGDVSEENKPVSVSDDSTAPVKPEVDQSESTEASEVQKPIKIKQEVTMEHESTEINDKSATSKQDTIADNEDTAKCNEEGVKSSDEIAQRDEEGINGSDKTSEKTEETNEPSRTVEECDEKVNINEKSTASADEPISEVRKKKEEVTIKKEPVEELDSVLKEPKTPEVAIEKPSASLQDNDSKEKGSENEKDIHKVKSTEADKEQEKSDKSEPLKEKDLQPQPAENISNDFKEKQQKSPICHEKIRNFDEESKGISTEMNEVEVEVRNEFRITIKLPAEKQVQVQLKGSPKFSIPELPSCANISTNTPTAQEEEKPSTPICKTSMPKFDPFLPSDSNNIEALGNLLNQMNPIRWPRDRAIQIRLEHIVHAVEKDEWPVSRFFSSAAMTETFDYTPQGTPDAATPVRDTPTPISECSDLAPPEDLIMNLPPANTGPPPPPNPLPPPAPTLQVVTSTTPAPTPTPGRRGRRRRIAIDVETDRAKLQALLSQNAPHSNQLHHVPTASPRLNSSLRRERSSTPTRSLNLTTQDLEGEIEPRIKVPTITSKHSKFQPPPPAHQHHSLSGHITASSLLRSAQQQHQQQQQQQQRNRSRSPAHRASPNFSTQSQSSSLDLSVKSSHKDVAAAAMSALSSLSSVTVTPVTLPSPSPKHSSRERGREREQTTTGGLTISSAPMDLSGGLSKRHRPNYSFEDKTRQQESPINFGTGTKKISKLENMLDKLKKRKLGESGDSLEPLPIEKDKKKRKLDEIVFGLSAAKNPSSCPPPMQSGRSGNYSHSSRDLHMVPPPQGSSGKNSSPQISSHSGARSGTPSPQVSAHQSAKDAQIMSQNFFNNQLLSALSMFNAKDLKDFNRYTAGAAANLSAASKKDSNRNAAGSSSMSKSAQMSEMPKCDISRLAEIAVPKFDLFSHDAKVNKWLAEHANMTPERPPSPEIVDRRRRKPRADPLTLDWNKLSGEENVPVVHRVNGKKITGPKAPQLKHLAHWLLENQNYDVDPRWAELVKERGNLPTDLQKRLSGEKKKGPGRPPTLTSPTPIPTSSSNTSVPTSSANNAFSNLGAFSNIPGLSGINPNLLASLPLGALDPKNPLFMPFGGLGSLGGSLGNLNLAGLSSLSGMANLGLPNSLFGLGFPGMGFGSDMSGMGGGNASSEKQGGSKEQGNSSSTSRNTQSSASKKEEKNKKANAAAAAAASQNLLSNSLPFLFPNPGLMYNPLGLGSFPLSGGMSGSPFGNLGQRSMLNGLNPDSGPSGSNKKSGSSGNKTNSSNNNPLASALNIPSLSKKDLKELAALSAQVHRNEKMKSHQQSEAPRYQPPLLSMVQPASTNAEDSDDESLKSLMGNHQDELPDDDPPSENAERIVLKESKELEKEMAQQKMETRRERRMKDREDSRGGLTSAERQLLMERKKERLAKEEPYKDSTGRTTRRSAAAASRSRLEDAVNKMREATESHTDPYEKE